MKRNCHLTCNSWWLKCTKLGFWDKNTITKTTQPVIAPTTPSGAMEFGVGANMNAEQTKNAYAKIAQPDTAMNDARSNSFWGKVQSFAKNEITPQPVEVRRAFETTPTKFNAPPIVTQAADLGFRLIEMIPRAIAVAGGEFKSKFQPAEVTANINLKRLGFETPNYITAAKQVQDAINNGENPWIAGLRVASNSTLDIAFGASLITDLAKLSTKVLLNGGVEARIEAQNVVDAYKVNSKETFARLKSSPLAEREKAMADLTNLKNEAEKILKDTGGPTAIDRARVNTARYTDVLGRETPITKNFWSDISKPDINLKTNTFETKAPSLEVKQLPGTREVPGQAPAMGLSLKEVQKVGTSENSLIVVHNLNETKLSFADKIGSDVPKISETDKTKLDGLKETLSGIKDQLANHPAKPLLKFINKKEGSFLDFKNPDLAKTQFEKNRIIKTNKKIMRTTESAFEGTQYSDQYDNPDTIREVIDQYKKLRVTEKQYSQEIKDLETELNTAIREKKSQETLNKLSEKMGLLQEKMIAFAEKYPQLAKLTMPMTTETTKGAIKGYKLGVEVGSKKTKTELIASFNEKNFNVENVRKQIVQYANDNLSLAEKGKLMSVVRDAKTPKDLAKAFMRIDRRVEEITLNNSIKELRKVAEKLSESPAVSVDYRNKIKDIISEYELGGHTQGTIDKLKATQTYLDTAKAEGTDVEIPQRILEKLKILSRVPKDQLTLSQVEGLRNEIELLGKLGETKWSTKQALYDNEKELRKNALLDTATPINEMPLPQKVIGTKISKWSKKYISIRNILQKSNISLTPIDGLADITGMHKMKATLDLNFGNYLAYNDENIKNWYALTKTFSEKEFERIGAYALSQQTGGIERLANSGITQAEIDAITLTPEEEKAYQFVRDTFESEFPNVKKYAQDVYNADVGQVDNYVSFMSDYEAMNDLEMYDRFGQRAEEISNLKTKTVEQGFTKTRAGLSNIKLELDINKIFRRHIDDVAYMLTNGRDIKMYSEIVNSPEMRAKLGDVGTMVWKQWLDLMARKGGSEGAKRIATLDIVRKNVAAGVLAFRLSSALVQFSSFADTIATIGAEYATKGASRIATSKEWRNFVMDNFPEVRKAVGDDIAFREFGEDLLGKMARVGLTPLQALDGLMRSTASAGAYEKLAFERGIKIDLKNPDRGIIEEATRLMRQSQGSSFFKDQPLAITAGYGLTGNKSLNKTILTFQSFMLNRWDNIKRQIWRMGIKEKNYKKASMSFFWLILFASAMEEGIRRGGRAIINMATGDNQEESSFVGNAVMNVVQNVPIAGSLISSMEFSSNPIPVINTYKQLQSGIETAVNGKELPTKAKGVATALGGLGSLLGVAGASQIAQIIKKAIPTEDKVRAKEMAQIKPVYDQVQNLNETSPEEAQKIIDNLSDADYALYKDYRIAEKTKATTQGKIDIMPTYKKIQELNKNNPDEAQKILDSLTDDQYHYYELVKKQAEKDKLASAGEKPTYDNGETQTSHGLIGTVFTYAKAIGTDPVTAFNRIFTGQRIRYVAGGAIIVERMSLDASQKVKGDRGGNTTDLKLDHIIPLELGGSNSENNLILIPTDKWESYTPIENYLGKQLRSGIITKKEVQDLIIKFKSGEITPEGVFNYK